MHEPFFFHLYIKDGIQCLNLRSVESLAPPLWGLSASLDSQLYVSTNEAVKLPLQVFLPVNQAWSGVLAVLLSQPSSPASGTRPPWSNQWDLNDPSPSSIELEFWAILADGNLAVILCVGMPWCKNVIVFPTWMNRNIYEIFYSFPMNS